MIQKSLVFIKKPFIQNVFVLASGTAMAQVVNMLYSPLITRIYGPVAYGIMGTFTAIIQIIGPIAALSYPIAIVLPAKDEEAKSLVSLSLIVTLINSIFLTILILLFNDFILNLFNLEMISGYIYLLPIVIFMAGISQILKQTLLREKQFKISANSNFLQTIFTNSSKLIIGLFYPYASILIIFTAFRQGVNSLLMYILLKKNAYPNFLLVNKISKKKLLIVAKKYKDFPLFRTPEVSLSAFSNNIPILILTSLFGPVSVGFYSLAKTVLGVPSLLVAQSVGDVFYPKIAKSAQEGRAITPLIIKATFYLSCIGIVPYSLFIIFGPQVFSFIFGSDWYTAGEYARWIALWAFFNFINRPSIQVLPVIAEQKFQLIFTVSKLFFTGLSMITSFYLFDNDIITIMFFGFSGALSYSFLILITIIKTNKFDQLNNYTSS